MAILNSQMVFQATPAPFFFWQVPELDAMAPARPRVPGRFSAPMNFTTFDTGTLKGTDQGLTFGTLFYCKEDVNDSLKTGIYIEWIDG